MGPKTKQLAIAAKLKAHWRMTRYWLKNRKIKDRKVIPKITYYWHNNRKAKAKIAKYWCKEFEYFQFRKPTPQRLNPWDIILIFEHNPNKTKIFVVEGEILIKYKNQMDS